MATRKRAALKVVALTVAVFLAGAVVGSVFFGDVGRTPCWQVVADVESARSTLSATFGEGVEGAAALEAIRAAAERRPDCFSPTAREAFNHMSRTTPQEGSTDLPTEVPSS